MGSFASSNSHSFFRVCECSGDSYVGRDYTFFFQENSDFCGTSDFFVSSILFLKGRQTQLLSSIIVKDTKNVIDHKWIIVYRCPSGLKSLPIDAVFSN